jgi:hypothetical protein
VDLARDFLRPGAPSSSPELRRRAPSSTAASRRLRRLGRPLPSSHAHALRPGEDPVIFGAPQRLFRRAPPLAVAPPPCPGPPLAVRRPRRSRKI